MKNRSVSPCALILFHTEPVSEAGNSKYSETGLVRELKNSYPANTAASLIDPNVMKETLAF